jgi:hypothetical protein
VARANAIQIAKAVDAKLIKNLNDESINWGSQLYDVAKTAQADPDSAWGMISTLQYQLLAMGDASDLGGNTWARMMPALSALADSLGMRDAVAAGRDRFQQTSDEERTRVNRGIRAWMAGDGSFEKLSRQDQEATQNALGMATLGTATGPGAAIGAMVGVAVGKATLATGQQLASVTKDIMRTGKLPSNYITKAEAENLGWIPKKGNLADVAPGKAIGGDVYENRNRELPDAPGRTWYEADIGYQGGYRGKARLVYSNDGMIYYSPDHYQKLEMIGNRAGGIK